MSDTAADTNGKNEGQALSHLAGLVFLREIDGREVWVAIAGAEQVILLENAGWSGLLAAVLARPEERQVLVRDEERGKEWVAVTHTREVDQFLWQLIDVLIDVRYHHPTYLQLRLALTQEEGAELVRVLGESSA